MLEYDRVIEFKEIAPVMCLLKKGRVATMRKTKYSNARILLVKHRGIPVALAKVDNVVPCEDGYIDLYTPWSGFRNKKTWIQVAKRLHGGKLPLYIIVLRKVKSLRNFRTLDEFR